MSATETKIGILSKIMHGVDGTIAYKFEDDTELRAPINPQCQFTERGTRVSAVDLLDLFKETMHDIGAVKFYISI